MAAGTYSPAFPYKHQLKDMVYAMDLADDSDVQLPVAQAVLALYESDAAAQGDKDFSAVLEASRAGSLRADVRTAK